ncbi:MAG: TlpA family protein disulfide reductase [Campylobacter sp.]|nr:TlpA family protein disulfide reductase [Campylobacter sp.]
MKKFLVFFISILFIFGCNENVKQAQGFKNGEEIELESVFGKKIALVYKNGGFVLKNDEKKVLMIDIFGTFCQPCQSEAPNIMDYQIQNKDKFMLIALTHYEDTTNEQIQQNFSQKYNAFYFISNDQNKNSRIINQIVHDIGYKDEVALPFKVVLKNSKYQNLTDVDSDIFGVKYYLGGVNITRMREDLDKIYANSQI